MKVGTRTRAIRKWLAGVIAAGLLVLPGCEQTPRVLAAPASGKPVALDTFGGFRNMPSPNRATGLFRVEKFGYRWMFVDPANNGFFMIGMYALSEDQSTDDMGSTYYQRTSAKYGDPGPSWAAAQLKRVQAWGFNSIAPYASDYVLPVTKDYRLPGDQTQPVKLPFIGLVRPAYYGMLNQNHWSRQPVKDMMYGASPNYLRNNGYRPSTGVADFYDRNLDTFLANELQNDPYTQSIKASPHKQYMIGMSADDGDQMYGFGKGPDFPGGYNNAHLGWIVLTLSPVQTANRDKGFVYQDSVVYSKQALRDQLMKKYKTISALNAAWGSNYTTFDSSGTAVVGEVIGGGDGSKSTFNMTLSKSAVTPMSLQIKVAGIPVAGDLEPDAGGKIWGPDVTGTIDYASARGSLTFAAGHAPAGGATITADYVQNGWGIGTGLMDEDGRPSHQRWVGKDFTFLKDVNANVSADIDNFLYEIAGHYFSMCRSGIQTWMPGLLYLGPDTLGTWGAPSNRNILRAAAQYIDVMSVGGGTPMTQDMVDFVHTYYGDKPFYVGEFRTANRDSAVRHAASVPETDFKTQEERGQSYFDVVTRYPGVSYSASGVRPYVGVVWWQYLDNWSERNDWGLVSLSDNAYDGKEARATGSDSNHGVPCSPPLSTYKCGGEKRDYGDVVSWVTSAHRQIQQMLQPADAKRTAVNSSHAN
jgi:hypothetical protein